MKSSKYIDVLGEQVPKRTVFFLVGAVTIVVGGVVALLYYFEVAPIVGTSSS